MALLYSDGTRQYLMKNLPTSELKSKNKDLYEIFMDILENRYYLYKDNDLKLFNQLKPENILEMLHTADENTFYFNSDKHSAGHSGEYYMVRLFEYFGMKKKVIYMRKENENYFYSPLNNVLRLKYEPVYTVDGNETKTKKQTVYALFDEEVKVEDVPQSPDLLVVTKINTLEDTDPGQPVISLNSKAIQETIEYQGNMYKISSTLTTNWNEDKCGQIHQIAGVTCNNERYIYNGWLKTYMNPKGRVPCELMKYDWLKKDKNFLLSTTKCELIHIKDCDSRVDSELCFNTFNIDNNTYIYVRVDKNSEGGSCKKNSVTPKKNSVTPKKNSVTPKKNSVTPKKNSVTPKKNSETGKKTTVSKKNSETGKKTTVSKKNEVIFNKDNKDQVLNKLTNRWVTSTGVIGRKIIKNN
jgi:hypothetical protein